MTTPYPSAVRGPASSLFFCGPYDGDSIVSKKPPRPLSHNTRSFRPHVSSRRDVRAVYPPTHVLSREVTKSTISEAPISRQHVVDQYFSRTTTSEREEITRKPLSNGVGTKLTWPMVAEFFAYNGHFFYMYYFIGTFWTRWLFYVYLLHQVFRNRIALLELSEAILEILALLLPPAVSVCEFLVWIVGFSIVQIVAQLPLVCQHLLSVLCDFILPILVYVGYARDLTLHISNWVSRRVSSRTFWLYAVVASLSASWVIEATLSFFTRPTVLHVMQPSLRKSGFVEVSVF